MSDQELYDIAQRHVDQRNRRWTLWAVDLAGLVISLAAVALTDGNPIATAIFLSWGGIFTLHTVVVALTQSRASSIENELARLRAIRGAADADYEKPKRTRLQLTDDGEIVETGDADANDRPDRQTDDWQDEGRYAQRSEQPRS